MDLKFQITNSEYINRKYEEFYKKHGYIPEMFNPYNCSEIIDYAPTITAAIGGGTTSADIWILKEINIIGKKNE